MNKIICGNSLEKLQWFPDNSVDLIVTDPPYGISFMSREWDKALPDIEIWKECLRVLKPGGFAFVMSIPRMDCQSRMAILLENSGFNIAFSPIYFAFSSGFPKGLNISKAIDKKLGFERKGIVRRDGQNSLGQVGLGQGMLKEYIDGEPASEEAKKLNGSFAGLQLKPAVEIVLVAMKSIEEKNYTEQALKNGKGISWVDNCRIPYRTNEKNSSEERYKINNDNGKFFVGLDKLDPQTIKSLGRYPANLLVSDSSLDTGVITKSIKGDVNPEKSNTKSGIYEFNQQKGFYKSGAHYGDSGDFSRYFDLDIWFEEKLKLLPESVQRTFPFLICSKASSTERNIGLNKENNHPTVKPIKLMSWLITLGSSENDIVLDPFCGSGSTCIAAKMLNRKYIGIELEPNFCQISELRLKVIGNLE